VGGSGAEGGFVDWVYANSPWVVIPVFLAAALGASSLCLWLRYRLGMNQLGSRHGRLAEFIVTNVAVIYAVLLAFIAVATWESYGKASDLTLDEATLAANLYRDAAAAPEPTRGAVESGVANYLTFVAGDGGAGEWQAMRGHVPLDENDGHCDPRALPIACGWDILARIRKAVATMAPERDAPGQVVLMQQMLRDLDALYIARSSRIDAARSHIPALVWVVIIILGATTIGYAMFVEAPGVLSHMAMLAGLTVTTTLVVVLIVELDFPFRGVISVDPKAYTRALADLQRGS
jgi:hypothetical protein